MKINFILSAFSVALAALMAYVIYTISIGDNGVLLTIISGISFFLILFSGIGIKYHNGHSNANIKVLSSVSFIIALISGITMARILAEQSTIIIVSALVFLLYFLVLYLIPKSGV